MTAPRLLYEAAGRPTPHDLFPNWNEKVAEAEAAGRVVCAGLHRHWHDAPNGERVRDDAPSACGFVYYRTANACPLCGTPDPTAPAPAPRPPR